MPCVYWALCIALTISFFIHQLALHVGDQHACGPGGTHTQSLVNTAGCCFSQTVTRMGEMHMSHCYCLDKENRYPCLTGALTRKCKASMCSLPRGAAPLLIIRSEERSYFKTTSFFASWTAVFYRSQLQDHLHCNVYLPTGGTMGPCVTLYFSINWHTSSRSYLGTTTTGVLE